MDKHKILELVYHYADEKLNKPDFKPGVSQVPVSGAVLYPEDVQEVADTLLEFWYTDWKKCATFKRRLCSVIGKKHCVLVNSGSSASLIAQTALLKRSKEKHVITTALGFPTTVYPIWQNGKVPIFIDIDARTFSPNWKQYYDAISHDAGILVFAHTLGFPFNEEWMLDFISMSNRSNFSIVDSCDALGAKIKLEQDYHHVGVCSSAMTLSFFPAHHITAGEGGAILTDNEELALNMEKLINWGRDCYCLPGQSNTCGKRFEYDFPALPKGWDHKYTFTELGYNLKMTEFQAALGMSQIKHLDDFVKIRRDNFYWLLSAMTITNTNYDEYFDFVSVPDWSEPSPFGFPIIVKKSAPFTANELISFLEKHEIRTRRFFGGNLIRQPFIKDLPYINFDLSETDYVMENGFWIGVFPGLTKEHLDYVLEIFEKFFRERKLRL